MSKTIIEIIGDLKELNKELVVINEEEAKELKQLATKFEQEKDAILKKYSPQKEVKEKGIEYFKKQIELLHKEKLDGASVDTSASLRLQAGNTILVSKLINKDPEFKWNAEGQRKGVAQLKSFGTALAKFIKIKEEVKWDELKKNCTIDKVTGVVHFSDATNNIEFDVAGIEAKPIGIVHELSFEEVAPVVISEVDESAEPIDVI